MKGNLFFTKPWLEFYVMITDEDTVTEIIPLM